jgi:hypothetical protein
MLSLSPNRPRPLAPRWPKATIPVCLLVGVVVIVLAVVSIDTHAPFLQPPSPVSNPALSLSGWKIALAEERTHKSSQTFSGRIAINGIAYVPAGASFDVEMEPGEVQGALTDASSGAIWEHEGGEFNAVTHGSSGWSQTCRAPVQPGLYRLTWTPHAAGASPTPSSPSVPRVSANTTPTLALDEKRVALAAKPVTCAVGLDVLVLAEAQFHPQGDRTGLRVNGKPIGHYLDPHQSPVKRVRENASQYQIPRFFALLTPETSKLHLGEDFDLEQLIAFKDYHGPDGKKVFTTQRHTDVLPICPPLIQKLIKLRERLRQKGVKVTRFWITSGFRTPEYNKSIGGAAYSRHCYGDAVDICIDEDGDHKMDDLNGDGKIDRKDGLVIANACRELELEGAVVPGGIGVYEWDGDDSVKSHVHIDCRGYISRWGQIGSGRTKKSFTWWPKAEFQEEDGE